jgi:hypothetical protein
VVANETIQPEVMANGKIQPADAAKMIVPFDVAGIRAEMARLLGTPKCGKFVRQLLDVVSRNASPANKLVEGGDVLKVFDLIVKKPNGLMRAGDTEHGALPGANFAVGSIEGGNARIQIGNIRPGAPVTMDELKAMYVKSDARFCIHETLHHSGRLVYSDQEFAIAASSLNGNTPPLPTPPPSPNSRFIYSQYWDAELRKSFK